MKILLKILSVVCSAGLLIIIFSSSYNFLLKKVYPQKYCEYVEKYSKEYNVEPSLVYAVIKTESGFRSIVESKSGAIGLMQIMPNTFDWIQEDENKYMDKSFLKDPEINIDYGTYFLSILLEKYQDENVALCAYNAGMGTVDKWLKDSKLSKDGKSLFKVPYEETRIYINKVVKAKNMYKKLYFN